MRRILVAVLGLLLADGAQAITAQTPNRPAAAAPQIPAANGEVRGTVVDITSSAPIGRASIALRGKPGGALIAGALAGADGSFRVQGLRSGGYTLRVTYLGYAPKVQDLAITDAAPVVNVGSIKLGRVAVALEGVAVTEERAAVTVEPDRNTYRAKDVAPAASNASEVLDAVPSVQVDADGKVSLRGNENVAVQINGRPSPIRGPQLGAFLKGLPANIVERVEVIPNPSARYDPEGMAGIINIVLKQNTDLGVSGGFNGGIARTDRYNASGNLGYQSGPLTTFTSLGLTNDNRPVEGINNRERLNALQSTVYTDQDIVGKAGNDGVNLTSSMDYKLSDRDVLSTGLTLNRRSSLDASAAQYAELNADRVVTANYARTRRTDAKGLVLDYNASLKRTFEPRKHELSAEVRLNRTKDEEHTLLWRVPTPLSSGTPTEGEIDDTDALQKQVVAQMDYTRPLPTGGKLESGYKGNARWLDRDYQVHKDALGSGAWALSTLSNAFTFGENVQAVYGVLSQGVGRFDLQAGLRGEYATRNFSLATQSYPYTYRSLFPSGAVLYNLSDATQLKASYSRRIRRPGTQELNPFPSFFDVQNVFLGNPNLAPEYTDAIELGVTRNGQLGTLQLSPFYRRTKNVIRVDINTADVIDGRDVTSVSFKNLATSTSWGTDINGSLRLGKKLNGFAGVNVFKVVTDGGSTSVVGTDAVAWMGRVNATSDVTPTLTLQGMYFYRAPMKIEKGKFSEFQMANVSLRQKLDGDALSVTLRLNDVFNTGRFRIRAGDDNIIQVTERTFGARAIFLTLQYNYGQAPRIRPPRPEPQQDQPAGFGP